MADGLEAIVGTKRRIRTGSKKQMWKNKVGSWKQKAVELLGTKCPKMDALAAASCI